MNGKMNEKISDITVRHIPFDYSQGTKRVFIKGEPESSYLALGFSLLLPYLEPYLIRHSKQAMALINNPNLQADMDAFCRQEAQHYTQHQKFNQTLLKDCDPVLAELEQSVKEEYLRLSRKKSLKFNLTYAEGFESATSASARFVLSKGLLDETEGVFGDILRWHLCEEFEHRNVAYDVYHHLYGDYFYRLFVSIYSQLHLARLGFKLAWQLYKADYPEIKKEYGGPLKAIGRTLRLAAQQSLMLPKLIKTYLPGYTPRTITMPDKVKEYTELYTGISEKH